MNESDIKRVTNGVMVSFVFDVEGCPERWSSSMEIRPPLKRLNQSKVT